MLTIIDLVYYNHDEFNDPQQVLDKHKPSLGFINFIKDKVNYEVIRHSDYEGKELINGVSYTFFKRSNASWQIPFKTHRYIKAVLPDIVLVHGFIFPLQVIALKMALGKKTKIILQHHGDRPAPSVRRFFQKMADSCADAYFFTAKELATAWRQQKIIGDRKKIIEVLEASVNMPALNKEDCRLKLGINGSVNFLWIGRLDANKDPLTAIHAFWKFGLSNPSARFYMIYHTEELLTEIKQTLAENPVLQASVHLIGKLPHDELACWYHACDFFVSASHYESSGYALLEAMHCGCIPIVTSIPSFNKITRAGKYGFLFSPGDTGQLLSEMQASQYIDIGDFSRKIVAYAKSNLGFENIADDIFAACQELVRVK